MCPLSFSYVLFTISVEDSIPVDEAQEVQEQTPSVSNYTSEEPSGTQSEITQDSQKVTKVNSECGKFLISDTALVVTIVT